MKVLKAIGLFLAVIAAMLFVWKLEGEVGGPLCYQLHGEYKGWVVICFEDPKCPPLRHEGLYLVIPIWADGRGCTASSAPQGWRYTRFEYLYPNGIRKGIRSTGWGEGTLVWAWTYSEQAKWERFFVGTEEELKTSWDKQPD